MNPDNTPKMTLAEKYLPELQKVFDACHEEFLNPLKLRANVVGMGFGVKWISGRPTGEPALLVLVTQKLEKELVRGVDRIPEKIEGVQTDVLSIGYPMAGGGVDNRSSLNQRIRPVPGGYSVGHPNFTAGTIATCVYDILPGGGASPPTHGVGVPSKYYILSNNHVLADSNKAKLGSPILQPALYDGGEVGQDQIATLTRFVPIDFTSLGTNLVDAAIAEGEFAQLKREVHWLGQIDGWRPKAKVSVGTPVKKTGRTTHFTTGRITAINATLYISYEGGKKAKFIDQIVTTPMSAGGDSGALITTTPAGGCCNVAVGLLFAESALASVANQIEHVRSLLRVEVAEQIL